MNIFRSLTPVERRTFYAAFGGWSLDALDYMVYTFVIATLISVWGITKQEAGFLGTVALLCSAVGGWIAGILADRHGRVRVLQITVIWFGIATLLIGFAQNYNQMLVLRAFQGIGFGGEWAVGSVLMGEVVCAPHRGRLVGYVQSGWAIGWAIAALLYSALFSFLPEAIAWRVLFCVSAVPAFGIILLRRNVPEPEVFLKARKSGKTSSESSLWAIFLRPLLPRTILASLLCAGMLGGSYAVTTWLPTYLKVERGLTVLATGSYLFVIVMGSFFGFLMGAWLSDKLGRKLAITLFTLLAFGSLYFYIHVRLSYVQTLILGLPLGFCSVGSFGGIGAYLTELFPSSCRANGQGFSYNFGRGIGALFPALVGLLSNKWSLGSAIVIFSGGAYIVAIAVIFFLPETRGISIEAVDAEWTRKLAKSGLSHVGANEQEQTS